MASRNGCDFDVADRAADFDQCHVGIACTLDNATLDLIGNVRNDLNRRAQIITTTLFAQDVFVHTAGSEVVVLGHCGADEPLVVTKVKVGFSAVVGDEHLTVLERAHGAWVHIDVGIQFQHGDLESPRLQDGRQ